MEEGGVIDREEVRRGHRTYLYPYSETQKPHTDSPLYPYTVACSFCANTARLSQAAPDATYHAVEPLRGGRGIKGLRMVAVGVPVSVGSR